MGGSSLTPSMRDFDSFIRECELLDPPLQNASFTWSNMQESLVCKRLDRFLYSNEWGLLFPQGLQEALIRRTLDHWPIVMDTNPFMWGPTPFRFENMWLQQTNFKENFRDGGVGFKETDGKSALRLDSPFTEEEISKAIFQLDRDKAPGPDGFTISVFQECWDVIKEICQSALWRLRGVLHETIHYTQGAFVQGRQILDAVLIANEIVDERRSAKGWVKASRGLRQGDPLSPFLFTLVADVLSRMLMRVEERNMMEGFRGEELLTLKSLLSVFGHISGLKVNLNKSSIYGINLDQAHLSRLAEMLDCKASGWPILYLGLPLGGNPKACGFWDPVVERISSRLDGWQKDLLILWGEDNSYPILSYPFASYFLSLFKIPASVAAKIERLQRDFLWLGVGEGKRDHLVRWDVVCKLKTIGGLGLGNISWRNLALLGKWLWSKMVTSLSLEGYCSSLSGVFFDYSVCGRKRGKNSVLGRFVVGDQPLGTQYPRLFRVVVDKNISISSVLGPSRPFLWNLNFRHNLSDSEIEDLEGLMRTFLQVRVEFSSFFQSEVLCLVSAHKKHGESADHLFLHCSLMIGLWHRNLITWDFTATIPTTNPGSTKNPTLQITIHKLNGRNFLQWSQSVKLFIRGKGKLGYLTSANKAPNPKNPAYQTWDSENSMVMAGLIKSMEAAVVQTYLFFLLPRTCGMQSKRLIQI
ncbi:hypothetical protein CK203_039628 [Vitis vinifera]|uniref:Retrotransposon Copia-like N-terminal domain-containing protein n=1 Tax=Vitis vinifera TaxID=29760 RepID=A0A438HFI8_VITVI|nr:hypothetical protein CK203_039628 [Vitis vinifera]